MKPAGVEDLSVVIGPDIDADADIGTLIFKACDDFSELPAVRDINRGLTLSYAQLLGRAVAQADVLTTAGVGPGDRVVVSLPRSVEEIIAVLAVLSVGAVYVPIDSSVPPSRLDVMLARVQPTAVLGALPRTELSSRLTSVECVRADGPEPPAYRWVRRNPDDIAHIMFTSGSTGVPKAVQITHAGVVRLARGASYLRRGPGERMLRLAPLAFDASTLEIFGALSAGSTLEVFPDGPVAPTELAAFIRKADVTVAFLTAGLFRVVVDEAPHAFGSVKQVATGGDVVSADAVRMLLTRYPGLTVTNAYGPAENTVITTVHSMQDPAEVGTQVPIGTPIAGTSVVVLDEYGIPTSRGQTGELYVAGSGLAAGYYGAPDETAKAFLVPKCMTERCYRTGDLVHWDDSGRLVFDGRQDRQVKIRGFRIELSEIEARLAGHDEVRDVAVVVCGQDAGSKRLLAAVVAEERAGLVERLRDGLRDELPGYMVPPLWAVVPKLPLTANGKVDVIELERQAKASNADGGSVHDGLDRAYEDIISDVWSDVLDTSDFGVDDGFFDVGGDSLLAGQVHTRLSALLPDHRLRIVDIFRHPTVQALADHLRGAVR
jgi:amino acid adenylation domain-containing protein